MPDSPEDQTPKQPNSNASPAALHEALRSAGSQTGGNSDLDEKGPTAPPRPRESDSALQPVSVVGIGASAGGIQVLQEFFGRMPLDSGLAFVVVMHLSPDHESKLPQILQLRTKMPVVQVTEAVKVERDHVYVIPPNKHLSMSDSMLVLSEGQHTQGRRVAIDLFFRTLAEHYRQRAVCIVLSGIDADGTIGLKHVKAQGGVTIAQDPTEAEYDSMPRHAIETGMVDWVLPVEKMPARLVDYVQNEKRLTLPPEDNGEHSAVPDLAPHGPGGPLAANKTSDPNDESALHQVLVFLRSHTAHDFSHYKRATILRRIARRLQVNSLEDIPSYLEFLHAHPDEARALLHDLLIGVTHFFRDQAAFGALEAQLPQLFAGKGANDQIRVWVPACATGEEAYSIAILLSDYAKQLVHPPSIQVFATDIDENAMQAARNGTYPATIEVDVSQERLRRYFFQVHDRYRIKKEVRQLMLFAAHDLLRDPPFSRLDLITCRNLLIYLKPEPQHRVLDIFHFALRPGGLLMLGGAESVHDGHAFFSPLDKHHRIYIRRTIPRTPMVSLLGRPGLHHPEPERIPPRVVSPEEVTATLTNPAEAGEALPGGFAPQWRRSLGELHVSLIEHYAPPSVIVDNNYDILHLSRRAGAFLHFSGGEPSANILKLVDESLRIDLCTALFRAGEEGADITVSHLRTLRHGELRFVDLHVRPAKNDESPDPCFLIVFDEKPATEAEKAAPAPPQKHEPTHRLDAELQQLRMQLNTTVEQYETANEELKASNEELRAMNEEMRSVTEELETSKEELQSINEELTTVNHELKGNIEALSRANSDLQNLMSSTDIGTLFLDRELRIKRYTPRVQELFKVIPSDLGRSLSDITSELNYPMLATDADRVMQDLVKVEREMQNQRGDWFLTRMAPYRTVDDEIDGVVVTFVDITQHKLVEETLRSSEEQLRRAIEDAPIPIIMHAEDGQVLQISKTWTELTGYTPEDIPTFDAWLNCAYGFGAEKARERMQRLFRGASQMEQVEFEIVTRSGERRHWSLSASAPGTLRDGRRFVIGMALDVTDRYRAQVAGRESERQYRTLFDLVPVAVYATDAEGLITEFNRRAVQLWGRTPERRKETFCGSFKLFHPDGTPMPHEECPMARVLRGEELQPHELEIVVEQTDGMRKNVIVSPSALHDDRGEIIGGINCLYDITEDKAAEQALRQSEERFRLLVEGAKHYAMFLLDPDNVITFWSAGAERLFGWTREEAEGQSGDLIFTPEDRARDAVEKEIAIALEKGRVLDRRWHMRKDGSRFWTDGIMMRLDHQSGGLRGLAKIARDATEERRAEEELRHARDELEQRVLERTAELVASNHQLQQTIADREQLERELLEISEREKRRIGEDLHDVICQELTATALLLKSHANRLEAKNPTVAETLNESAQIVNRNVSLARDLARGLQPAELTTVGLNRSLRDLAQQANENREINCEFRAARGVRVRDDAVALHLYRIAQEAVTNAVKHSGAKNILITLARDSGVICLKVGDDGKGLPTRKRRKGFGLHLMKYRANVLGGTLTIESGKRKGTTVTTCLPGR